MNNDYILTPEFIHGLDYDLTMGIITSQEYDELVKQEIQKQSTKEI